MGTVWKQLRQLGAPKEGLGPARPPTPGARLARGVILTALAWAVLSALVGLIVDDEFIASSRMYPYANTAGVAVWVALLLPGVWLARAGHFNAGFYALTRRARAAFVALAVPGAALIGLLAWTGTMIGVGWLLHQVSDTQNQVREYTIVKPRTSGVREVWCRRAIYFEEANWPNDRVCGFEYGDWRFAESGMSLRLSGTVSEFGFVMEGYDIRNNGAGRGAE